MKKKIFFTFFLLAFMLFAKSLVGQAKFYTLNNSQGLMSNGNMDGSSYQTLVSGLSNPDGAVISFGLGRVFWVEGGGKRHFRSANLDGTDVQIIDTFNTSGRQINPRGIAIDEFGGKFYIIGASGYAVCNLDGSNMVVTESSTVRGRQIAVNTSIGKMFVTSQSSRVFSFNLDGTGIDTVAVGFSFAWGVRTDLVNNKLYFSDNRGIYRCNFDGSSRDTVVAIPLNQGLYISFEIDPLNNRLVYANNRNSNTPPFPYGIYFRPLSSGTPVKIVTLTSPAQIFDVAIGSASNKQAFNINFSSINASSATATWSSGNGTGRAIFVTTDTTAFPSPLDGVTYSANSLFGSGTQIGTSGWFCVGTGNINTATITGLTPNTHYRMMVCEYSGVGTDISYNRAPATLNPRNFKTNSLGPSVSLSGTLNPFLACANVVSAEQSFTVSGSGLTHSVNITAPSGFEISLTPNAFANSLTINHPSDGILPSTTIYVRMLPSSSAPASGNITVNSTGVSQQTIAVSGNLKPSLSIATASASSISQCIGTSVSFTATATGAGTLSYQWRKNGNIMAGELSNLLTLNNITSSDAANYTLTITDECSSKDTSFTLAINPAATITTQPANATLCSGSNANFSVNATGTGLLTYQWKKNGNIIVGASANTLTLTNITASDAANYTVEITSSCGSITSAPAVLAIDPLTTITMQPAPVIQCAGAQASFTVTATGTSGLTYQWKKNGVNIAGANSNTLLLNNITATDAANYSVDVVGTCNTINSSAASLVVNPLTTITAQPNATTLCAGSNATFSVSATGTGALTYQWKKNGNIITGATSSTLNLSNVSASDAANYTVDITGVCGTITSASAALGVNPITVITSQPVSATQCVGTQATFTVTATGSGILSFQWKKNGVNIVGANSSSLILNNISATDAADYTVDVVGACGTLASAAAVLVVNPTTSITSQPTPAIHCVGSQAVFSVNAAGTGILNYQWKKNGVNIAGANSSTLTISNLTTADAGDYTVEVLGSCGVLTSNAASLVVNALTAISQQPVGAINCAGTGLTLNVLASGTGTLSYQWKKNGANIFGATNSSLSINALTAADAGDYTVEVLGACNAISSNAATVVVNPLPAMPVINLIPKLPICEGTEFLNFEAATPPPPGVTYQWSTSPNAHIHAQGSTSQYALVSFPNSGIVSVILTATQNGCSVSTEVELDIKNESSHTALVRYFNNHFVCEANLVTDYQWGYDDFPSLRGNVLANEIDQNYFNPAPELSTKNYWVITTKENCYQKTYYNAVLSENEPFIFESNQITAYPNPFESVITLASSLGLAGSQITLTDVSGKVIQIYQAENRSLSIDLSHLAAGFYFVRVQDKSNKTSILKIVKN